MVNTSSTGPISLDLETLLREALAPLSDDELAYLVLTGKAERSLQDRLAWRLQNEPSLRTAGLLALREWRKRIDIAMVDEDDRARGLIELKSLFSADATPSHGDPSACIRGISNDIATRAEVRKDAGPHVRTWEILAVVHPVKHLLPATHPGVRKYARLVNKALDERGGEARVWEECREHLETSLAAFAPKLLTYERHGFAFGFLVSLRWFVLGPLDQNGDPV